MDVADLRTATNELAATLRWAAPEQWSEPTPCPDWDVRALVGHLVVGHERFVARLSGETPSNPPGIKEGTPEELVEAYERTAEELIGAFEKPGALQRLVELPIGTLSGQAALDIRVVEAFVHGWDIAQALGTTIDFDDDTVEKAIAFSEANLSRLPPERSPFGTPKEAPATAPPLDRLAALLGRTVP